MQMNEIDWEEIFLDADFSVPDQRGRERHGVRVKVAWVHETELFKAVSSDISSGGLFIATSQILERGTEFKLAFKLPTCDEPLRAIGRVAWIRADDGESPEEPRGFGVEFLTITQQAQASVDTFIQLREALLITDAEN
jgi:uncharacterized protein (TIGR02266 family)